MLGSICGRASGSEDLGADAFFHDHFHAVEVDYLLGHDLAALAGLDLTVHLYQPFGDQRLGRTATIGPTLMFDKVAQGNEGVAFEQKRSMGNL